MGAAAAARRAAVQSEFEKDQAHPLACDRCDLFHAPESQRKTRTPRTKVKKARLGEWTPKIPKILTEESFRVRPIPRVERHKGPAKVSNAIVIVEKPKVLGIVRSPAMRAPVARNEYGQGLLLLACMSVARGKRWGAEYH